MTKLAPEWVRTSGPVIRSPARYRWTTVPACVTRWSTVGRSSGTVQKSRNMFFNGCEYFMGTTGDGDVSDCFNFDGGGTSIRTKNEGITGRTTTGTVDG